MGSWGPTALCVTAALTYKHRILLRRGHHARRVHSANVKFQKPAKVVVVVLVVLVVVVVVVVGGVVVGVGDNLRTFFP